MQSAGDGHGSVSGVGVAGTAVTGPTCGAAAVAGCAEAGGGWTAVVAEAGGCDGPDDEALAGAVVAECPNGTAAFARPRSGVGLADVASPIGSVPRPRRTATIAIAATTATATAAIAPGTIGPCRIVPCSFCSV